jgi:hypothetical protein
MNANTAILAIVGLAVVGIGAFVLLRKPSAPVSQPPSNQTNTQPSQKSDWEKYADYAKTAVDVAGKAYDAYESY